MKRILIFSALLIALLATVQQVEAQRPERSIVVAIDTAVNTDTSVVTLTAVPSHIISFQSTVTRLAGTVGGKVYLEGTTDGVGWIRLDSMTLTNQAINSKLFTLSTQPPCWSYRAYYISSGSQSSIQRFSYTRRP